MSTATATKTTDKTADKPVISEATQALANVFKKSMSIDKDGTVKIEGDLVADNLPTDLTMAEIKRVQKHRGEVVAAATLAIGELSLAHMKKHKDINQVAVAFKLGHDKVELAVDRSREFNDGKGGKLLKHGYVSVGYTASGATNSGEFKKARAIVADQYASEFGG